MNMAQNLYGTTVSVGNREVHIQPQTLVYSPDAVTEMVRTAGSVCPRRRVTVLADARTREVAGAAVGSALSAAGFTITEVVVPDSAEGRSPICDADTYRWVLGRIGDVDAVVAVGSGVVNDLAKWTSFDRDLPYLCVATAASMNGYTSANVASTVDGVKRLQRARPARGVFATPDTIESAPFAMTASGLGDALAKNVSTADWYLNHVLFGDEYIEESVTITRELEPLYTGTPKAIRNREPQAIEALFRGLALAGVAMTLAGTSAPASGGEHLISHTLDMWSSQRGLSHDLHGRQVGVGTILSAELYRRVLAAENPVWEVRRAVVTDFSAWGAVAAPASAAYAPKIERINRAAEILGSGDGWNRLRETLSGMVWAPETIQTCLRDGGAAHRAEDIGCSKSYLTEAFVHAHEMRSRFTILDLARMVGIMPDCAREIVEAYV